MQTIIERNATPATAKPPKLMDRVRESLRAHRYALSTERTYCHWIKRFIFFHGKRHPADMGAAEVEAFLSHLATADRVSASTQNQALHAVLYLYKQVLGVELPWLDGIVRARESKRLPAVLTQRETAALLRHVHGTSGTIECRSAQQPDLAVPDREPAGMSLFALDNGPEHAAPWEVLEGIRPLDRPIIVANEQRARLMFLERFIELTNWRAS